MGFDFLYDYPYRSLQEEVEGLRQGNIAAGNRAGAAARKTRSLETRLEQQELLLEALVRGILDRGLMTREEIQDLVAQADLEDGVEDGRMGPSRIKKAPKCGTCERPVNPKREHCVYCGAEVPEDVRKKASRRRLSYRR